jgi:hypothetical protein
VFVLLKHIDSLQGDGLAYMHRGMRIRDMGRLGKAEANQRVSAPTTLGHAGLTFKQGMIGWLLDHLNLSFLNLKLPRLRERMSARGATRVVLCHAEQTSTQVAL